MCGVYLTNKTNVSTNYDYLLRSRGPDYFGSKKFGNFFLKHTLLSMTGEFTKQPIVKNHITLLFNGEIYNYKESGVHKSDAYKIIECYEEFGLEFLNQLDGEFAIILIDEINNQIIFSTDIFGTKPLYYSFEGENISVASYRELLLDTGCQNIFKCKPNTLYILKLNEMKLDEITNIFKFDLNQKKNHFDDWNDAFIDSLNKRFSNTKFEIILPLSSGHDSGAISCGLNLLNIAHNTFSYYGNEDSDILNKRIEITKKSTTKNYKKENLGLNEKLVAEKYLLKNCSQFFYGPDLNSENINGFKDPGAYGLVHLLNLVKSKNENIRILASGQGGDEIMTNIQTYTFGNSNPKKFPRNLSKVFPWQNFFYGSQSSYLSKEESISGSFGIEGRYPLLDKKVVQEFLWLYPKLKNRSFKSPLSNFMEENSYPYLVGKPEKFKRGFNV